MSLSKMAMSIPPSGIREMTVLAAQYENVISFGLGEPDFYTPQHVIDAGCKALNDGWTKYVPNQGVPALLTALAEKARNYNKMDWVTEKNIHITYGAGQALLVAMEALLDPGDEVLVPTPGFPNYFGYIHVSGGVAVAVPTKEENGFCVTPEELEAKITPKTKVIVLNSPGNPTGGVLSEEEIRKIADVALKHDLYVVSDEPYEAIIFDGLKNFSIASIPEMKDRVITVNSFSKSYAMTGWRIGYLIASEEIRERATVLQESMGSSVTAVSQMAALAALQGPQDDIEIMRSAYESRRNILIEGLNQIKGFSCIMPKGAFYAFVNVKEVLEERNCTAHDLAIDILDKIQVLVTPGHAFGEGGEHFIRFSYASSEEAIREGIRRLKAMFGEK